MASEKVKSYLRNKDVRNIKSLIKVNGVEMSGYVRPISIRKGSCGGGSFQPASIYSNSMSAVIYDGAVKKGSKVEVFFSVPESGDSTYYKEFTGYARNSMEKNKELTLDAEGAIAYKLGKEYTGGVGLTINAMLDDISAKTGVNIILEDGLDGSYTTNQHASLDGYLMRQILGYIAGCFFGYATEDEEGNIVIRKYGVNAEDSVELKASRMGDYPDVYNTVTVEGIQVFSTDSDGQVDYVYPEGVASINCSIRNPLMTKELFDAYVQNFAGLTYTPFSAEMSLGDFTITPNSSVIVNGKQTIITEITHYYDGGLKTNLSASTISSSESYSRTEQEKESDIAFSRIQGGNLDNASPSEPVKDVVYVDLATSQSQKKQSYLEVRHGCFVIAYLAGNINRIPQKYKPAFPVTYYSATPIWCDAFTILPETYKNGVKYFVNYSKSEYSYISPKDPYKEKGGSMQYLNWDNYTAGSATISPSGNAGVGLFWIIEDKLEELLKAGEEYNDSIRKNII